MQCVKQFCMAFQLCRYECYFCDDRYERAITERIPPRIILGAQGHLRKIVFKLLHMNQKARKDRESHLFYSPASGV